MKAEEHKKQNPQEHTKDDSSDLEKVKEHRQQPPPEPEQAPSTQQEQERKEAEKGHS